MSYILELIFPRCCAGNRRVSFDDHLTVSFSSTKKDTKTSEETHLLFMDKQKTKMKQDHCNQYYHGEFFPKENEFLRTIPW